MGLKGSNKGARINRYESGASGTNLDELERLAEMLHVPAAALIAEDRDIAEAIKLMAELPTRKRKQLLKVLRELAQVKVRVGDRS
ncbi:MAG: XRE family transcriptional regulator [Proteobacteria bacterium]|nr:XRE family transcriptional regulator [Pseudomonadota bacterium]